MTPARTFVAALLIATAVPVGATAGSSAACPAKVSTTVDGWRRVAGPAFGAGQPGITAYAVMPHDPGTMLVTNGQSILRSSDDGCAWSTVFTLPGQPSREFPLTAQATIVDVAAGKQRAYALVRDAGIPRVLVSSNAGGSWRVADIPAAGTDFERYPPKLVTDSSGMYAYLTARPTGGILVSAAELLYATEDGGTTWAPRPVDLEGGGGAVGGIVDVAVDPLLGTDVWVTTGGGLFRSGDAGKSWTYTMVGDQAQSLGVLAVAHRADAPVLVVVAAAFDGVVWVRRAGGGWTTVNTPGTVTSAAGGRTMDQVAITTASGTYELDIVSSSWQPMHRGAPVLSRLSTDDTARASFYACACDGIGGSIWSRAPRTFKGIPGRGADHPGVPGLDGCAPDKQHPDPADFGPSAVTGKTPEITVPPGKTVKVPYTFRVRPRELDLYFLVDTGPRSRDFSCLAKQGTIWAAYELARSRNLRVGLGQYRDYLVSGQLRLVIGNCLTRIRQDFVYRRDLRIGPVDKVFRDAVSGIGYGLECTSDHAGLPALLQSATGLGQDVAPRGPSPYDIAPGQEAMFAPDAYKVILHVAGGYFSTPSRVSQYPGPEFEPVIEALKDADIKQVGVNVPYVSPKKHHGTDEPPDPPEETGHADLARVADATGALAATPVDCGNQIRSSVGTGEPLVCTYLERGRRAANGPPMGKVMVDLVNALRDVQPMRLTVLSGDARLTQVAPATTRHLDNLRAQTLTYTVTFECRPHEMGTVKRVRLGGEVGSTVVATNETTVRCGAPPEIPRPPQFVAALPQAVQRAAPLANLPPNSNLAPQTATQPNSQLQQLMQAAMTHQEEAEHEVALAHIERPPATEEELAMSALPRREPVPPWALAEVAAMVTLATAWEVSRRVRTSFGPARVRSR